MVIMTDCRHHWSNEIKACAQILEILVRLQYRKQSLKPINKEMYKYICAAFSLYIYLLIGLKAVYNIIALTMI